MDFLTQFAQIAQQNWLLLALMAMFFASLGNLTLKVLVKDEGLLKIDWLALLPVALIVVLALVAGWLFFVNGTAFKITSAQLFWIIALAVFGLGAFACTMFALQSGKVALVTAVLSLSTVFVALFSVVFLGDKFDPKQVVALALAVISILLLVL